MCPQGKHAEGYRWPRKGERRRVEQPTAIQKLPAEQRNAVRNAVRDAQAGRCTCAKRKAHWHPWLETPAAVERLTGQQLSESALRRDYDIFVEQVDKETRGEAAAAKAIAEEMARLGFEKIPEGALNALSAEVFKIVRRDSSAAERVEALGNLVFLQSKFTDAQAKEKRAAIEERKLKFAEKKFEDLKAKAEKALNEVEAKIGSGKQPTAEDIRRLRERTFGKAE